MSRGVLVGGIEVVGLRELQKNVHPKVFRSTMRIALRRSGNKVKGEAQRHFDRRSMYRSSLTERVGQSDVIVFSTARPERTESIHEGRQPNEAPTIAALERWLNRKSLLAMGKLPARGTGKVTLRARAERAGVDQRVIAAAARRLQDAIRERGTKPIPFFRNAIPATRDDLNRYFREALREVTRKFAGKR